MPILSPRFTSESYKQSNVKLLKQFDKWAYNVWYKSVNNRMPWRGARKGILTTSGTADRHWWGTIISDSNEYKPAPWINSEMANPGLIWYWVNEDDCSPDRMPGTSILQSTGILVNRDCEISSLTTTAS